jgi:hypothetical protein
VLWGFLNAIIAYLLIYSASGTLTCARRNIASPPDWACF